MGLYHSCVLDVRPTSTTSTRKAPRSAHPSNITDLVVWLDRCSSGEASDKYAQFVSDFEREREEFTPSQVANLQVEGQIADALVLTERSKLMTGSTRRFKLGHLKEEASVLIRIAWWNANQVA